MRPVVKVDKRTREVVQRFDSLTKAAKKTGRNLTALQQACSERHLGWWDHYFRFEDDFDPEEDFSGNPYCPVVTVDVDTNRARWHACKLDCAKAMYVHPTAVSQAIRTGCKLDGRYRVLEVGKRLP